MGGLSRGKAGSDTSLAGPSPTRSTARSISAGVGVDHFPMSRDLSDIAGFSIMNQLAAASGEPDDADAGDGEVAGHLEHERPRELFQVPG